MAVQGMRAAGIESFGGDVHVMEVEAPGPLRHDEISISVRAAGVANWDEFVRVGQWNVGIQPPMALGVAAAGVVTAVGAGVTDFAAGDEVLTHPLPLRHQGAWAGSLVAPATLVAHKPPAVAWDVAAAFPVPALTADQSLSEVAPRPDGEWVLVHGAGGVTGGLIVQWAVARGATVVATAGPSSADRVSRSGAHLVVDYHDPDWPERINEASPGGDGVRAAVNAAPGGAAVAMRAVVDGGRLATITGDPPPSERDISIASVYVKADGVRLEALAAALEGGSLSIDVAAAYPLEHAGDALKDAVEARRSGAIVLML
jgi:NADPH:quinone reductase-like Zn-dependent oxidoreductase